MSEDIFKYAPITEWNGEIVDFGMPSTDGDVRLTEICLDAESCLEASKNAMDLSWTSTAFVKARTSPVQKIIRTLFGEDTGIIITTFTQQADDGAIHYMSPMVFADMQIYEKDWGLEVVNQFMNLAIEAMYYDKWTGPDENSGLTYRTYAERETHASNPQFTGVSTSGIRPIVGNWDTDGDPWVEVQWEHISTGHCSDDVSNNQTACEASEIGGFCRQTDFNNPLIISMNHTASCDDTQYITKLTCNNAGQTWTSYQIPYDSKEITFPAHQVSEVLQPLLEVHCLGNVGSGWSNGGKCLYTRDQWTGGAGVTWGHVTGFSSRTACMETSQTQSAWDDYYLMWIEQTNTWTSIYATWRPTHNAWGPSYGSSGPAFIPGTVNSHKRYNILTANNHRKYGKIHASSGQDGTFAPTNFRMYSQDENWSWGNGSEVGRSTIPMWITNTFEWENREAAYEYCHGPGIIGDNPQSQWSPPTYTDDVACLAAGDCSNNTYENNENGCLALWQCSGGSWSCTDWSGYPWPGCWNQSAHSACVNAHYCSGGGHTSQSACVNAGYYYCSSGGWGDSSSCTNAGECWYHAFGGHYAFGQYNNNPGACNSLNFGIGGPHYHYYGYTWNFANYGYTWNSYNYTWNHAHSWMTDGNTWSTTIPMVESVMPVEPQEYYWNLKYEAHGFVNGFNYASRPLDEYGYTASGSPDSSKIRWKPPQWTTAPEAKYYPRPSHFRIYRAPWVSPEGYSLTGSDYEADMWKIAGEVICNNEAIYHYFYDSRADLVKEHMGEFDRVYYRVTAVWKDWNWKRGYWVHKIGDWDGSSGFQFGTPQWDIRMGMSWQFADGSPGYFGSERIDGMCSGSTACDNLNPTHEAECLAASCTWAAGQWTGTSTADLNASLALVESAPVVAGWPQYFFAAKRVMYNHTWAWQRKTFRYSGYFRAPVTGDFKFEIKSDDSSYLWFGANGESLSTLVGYRNNDNFLAAVPGDHGVRYHVGHISLVKDEIHPLLVYYTNNNGPGSLELRTHYPDGEWNDGGIEIGEWKFVHHYMMPGDMDPVTQGDGQTVEGWETANDVYSFYTS